MVLDCVTDSPVVIAAVEALKPEDRDRANRALPRVHSRTIGAELQDIRRKAIADESNAAPGENAGRQHSSAVAIHSHFGAPTGPKRRTCPFSLQPASYGPHMMRWAK